MLNVENIFDHCKYVESSVFPKIINFKPKHLPEFYLLSHHSTETFVNRAPNELTHQNLHCLSSCFRVLT